MSEGKFTMRLGPDPGKAQIELDGVDVTNQVRSIDVSADAYGPPRVTLELVTSEVYIEGVLVDADDYEAFREMKRRPAAWVGE